MDIMELGAIGELVGGLAVVGSLIYVGYQIRQNSSLIEQSAKIAKGATLHAINDSYTTVYGLIAQQTDLAEIYAKGLAGGELSATEVVRYEALLQLHFAWLEDIYHQQKLELMGEVDPTSTWPSPPARHLSSGSSPRDMPRSGGTGTHDTNTPMTFMLTSPSSSWAGKRRLVSDMHRHLDDNAIP